MLKLVPILKSSKSLKLLLVDMKADSSVLKRLKQTSKNALFSLWFLQLE